MRERKYNPVTLMIDQDGNDKLLILANHAKTTKSEIIRNLIQQEAKRRGIK